MIRSLATIAILGWAGLATAEVDQAVVLETPALELHLQRSPVPHVERLVHKKSGTAVISQPFDRDLFAVMLRAGDGKQRRIAAGEAKRSKLEVREIKGGRAVLMEWSEFPDTDISVRATVRSTEAEPLLIWSIEVDNRSGGSLDAVRFPRLAAVPSIGESKDDFLVLPALPGILIDNPAEAWPPGYNVLLKYPGNLSAQFMAYQDRAAGLYLSTRDTVGHSMTMRAARHKDGFLFWHEYVPPANRRKDKSWVAPYPVVIGVTQGTWCDSADIYKRWTLQQPWCAKTLVQRADIPGWWKKGPDVHVVAVRTFDKDRVCSGSYYPKLMDHLRTYRRQIDGPVVPMLASWENHRRWTGGDYFPIFDEPQARKVIQQMRGEGFRPFFFLSGLFYTFHNEGRNGSKIPGAEAYLPHFVIDEKTGKPATYTLNESNPRGDWKRHSYQFCVADPAAKKFFCKVVDRAHELGIDVLQMDQTTSGAGAACYSDKHVHPPGPGLYQTHAFHDILKAMRKQGKKNTADFVLFHEEPHEQLIPYLDGFHVREYYAGRWYRAYRGTVGIPLFCYLYHEYAIGYGGDSAGLSPHNNRHNVRAHAINMVSGRTPGGSVWSSHQNALDAHADQIAMLRNHCRLLKTPAGEFLMLGRMLHPFVLDVPKLSFRWPDRRDPGKVTITQDPAVLTSSWQAPSGKIGHLFVNMSEEPQSLNVPIDTRNVPGWPLCDASLYSSAEDAGFQPLWTRTALPKQFARTLKPLEVVFLEIRHIP